MNFEFDHLVHFTLEPNKAIEVLEEKGIHAVEGGSHSRGSTYNTLSYFDLSYIEFLGATDTLLLKEIDHPRHSLLEKVVKDNFQDGFAKFAIRTTNIEAAAEHFREKGLTVTGPVPLSRTRPDGSVINWKLLYVGEEKASLDLPFIIEWEESDEERRSDLTNRNVITDHPSEATFSHLTFVVDQLEETVSKWADLLNVKASEVTINEQLQAEIQILHLSGGNLVFQSPIGEGRISSILKERGDSLYQANLLGNVKETFELLGGNYQINTK